MDIMKVQVAEEMLVADLLVDSSTGTASPERCILMSLFAGLSTTVGTRRTRPGPHAQAHASTHTPRTALGSAPPHV